MYELYEDAFDCLPTAACVNGEYLCVHGGISPNLRSLDDINAYNRFMEPEEDTLMADLLWSDPCTNS